MCSFSIKVLQNKIDFCTYFFIPLYWITCLFIRYVRKGGGRGRNAAGKSIDKIMSLVGNPSLTDLSPLWLWKLMQLLSPLSLSRTGENKSPNTKWNIKQLLIQTYFIECRELGNKINFVNAELYFSWLNPSCPLPRKSRVILFPKFSSWKLLTHNSTLLFSVKEPVSCWKGKLSFFTI